MNVSLVAISPQLPDETLSTAEKNALDFDVLSDVGNRVARQFGLVFELPEYVRSLYMGYGANLPKVNGDDSFELPMTAVYVLDRAGVVRHAWVDADSNKRPATHEIVAAAQQVAEMK